MAIDFHAWDTYFYAGVAATLSWLCKTVIDQGKEIAAITYYIERRGKDAAMELNRPNPTPADMQTILSKYTCGDSISDTEECELTEWLRSVANGSDMAKRSAALALLTRIATGHQIASARKWWMFWRVA